MARVVLERLTKIFGTTRLPVPAVRDLSVAIEDKELLVLAGPSGCGKTTTLRLIAGLEEPTSGTISFDGKVVSDLLAKDREVAMVFQNLALYPHMTAYENLAFGLKARKHSKTEISRRIEEAAAILDLTETLDRKPAELSGGQRQRVALGRAIVLQPKLLLLDEPLSNLDPPLRARMRLEIFRLHAKFEGTMIYVTHDQIDAMTLGHRIALLKNGELQQLAEPPVLYRRPANLFVAGFFGSPSINAFQGKLIRKNDGIFFEEDRVAQRNSPTEVRLAPFVLPIPATMASLLLSFVGKPLVMGIRPEDIVLSSSPANGGVKAILERVEMPGSESHLHLTTAAHTFIMRCSSAENHAAGGQREVRVQFNVQSTRFFDPVSGKTIG